MMFENEERQTYYVIHHVNSGQLMRRFDGRWTHVRTLAAAEVFLLRTHAESALQALLQEAGDRVANKEHWADQMWWDLRGGLVVVQEIEITARFSLTDEPTEAIDAVDPHLQDSGPTTPRVGESSSSSTSFFPLFPAEKEPNPYLHYGDGAKEGDKGHDLTLQSECSHPDCVLTRATDPLVAISNLALLEACDHRFGSLTLYGRGSVHLILEQLKSYVEEGTAPMASAPEDRSWMMNQAAFEKMIAENLAWLDSLPHSLERSHVREIVRNCVKHYYPAPLPVPPRVQP